MANKNHRYRITVTPVGGDGLQCPGRSTIEFEHACHDDWMALLESFQRQRGFSGDERAALTVGTELISGLMLRHRNGEGDVFAPLRPHMDQFVLGLKLRNRVE